MRIIISESVISTPKEFTVNATTVREALQKVIDLDGKFKSVFYLSNNVPQPYLFYVIDGVLMTKDILDMKMKGTETVEVLSAVSGG